MLSSFDEFELARDRYERLLNIKPEERSEENLFELMKLTQNLKIFETFKLSNIHKEICKHITKKTYERGEIIFKQGDEGDAYYFILRGTVDLYMYDVDQIDGKTKLKLLTSFLSGNGFGELALLYDCPRTGTAIPNIKTDLLIFKKKLYNSLVKDLHEKELFDLVRFYYSIPIFKQEPISNILKYCLRTNKEKLNSYDPFLKVGDYLLDYIFIEVGIVKAYVKVRFDKRIINNLDKYNEEKFSKVMQDLQNCKKDKKNAEFIYDEILEIMEFSEKQMMCEFYAIKTRKLDIFILPILPAQVITIKVDDFKKINPYLNDIIEKFAIPILDWDRIFKKFYKNINWKNYKNKLLVDAFTKKD